MQTIQQFLQEHPIQLTSVKVPDRTDVAWPAKGASHYACTLVYDGHHQFTYFSLGSAYRGVPSVAMVLDSLASDAASVESCDTFADWCSECGCDDDSRAAYRTFQACRHAARDLKRLLGETAYTDLVSGTERL